MKPNLKHKVVLVDDHTLIRKAIAELIGNFENYKVIWDAGDGKEFIEKLKTRPVPEIVVLDVAMPVMNGFDTARFLKTNYPALRILILSVTNHEDTIIEMIKIGVHGYIVKDAAPYEFKAALDCLIANGTYYTDYVSETMAKTIESAYNKPEKIHLTPREIQFLELLCTDITYKK